jgi:FkbM family methyltransferase
MVKELALVLKECGWSDLFFYILYKIQLKLKLLTRVKQRALKREQRIEKIYNALQLLHFEVATHSGVRYINRPSSKAGNVPCFIRLYGSDRKVFEQVMENEEYKSVVEIYRQLFGNEPSQIFDCGANIGLASLYLHHHFPAAAFTLVEPFEENSLSIALNCKAAGLQNYTLLRGGIWNSSAILEICREFRDKKEWSIQLKEASSQGKTVQGYSLAELVERAGLVDILKIDVEGAEVKLFENNTYAAAFLKRVKCITLEIHDEYNIRTDIYTILSANHFFYFNTNELTIGINRNYL